MSIGGDEGHPDGGVLKGAFKELILAGIGHGFSGNNSRRMYNNNRRLVNLGGSCRRLRPYRFVRVFLRRLRPSKRLMFLSVFF
jgi:hypothetical protein